MPHELDNIDRNILRQLQRDATLSLDALSEEVNLSRNACWRRVKLLEETKVIDRRVALIDPEKVGLGLSAFVTIRTRDHEPDWLTRFEHAVRCLPEITGAYRLSGDLDYLLKVQLADVKDYDRFYQRLIKLVSIAEISACFVMDNIKDTTEIPV